MSSLLSHSANIANLAHPPKPYTPSTFLFHLLLILNPLPKHQPSSPAASPTLTNPETGGFKTSNPFAYETWFTEIKIKSLRGPRSKLPLSDFPYLRFIVSVYLYVEPKGTIPQPGKLYLLCWRNRSFGYEEEGGLSLYVFCAIIVD